MVFQSKQAKLLPTLYSLPRLPSKYLIWEKWRERGEIWIRWYYEIFYSVDGETLEEVLLRS